MVSFRNTLLMIFQKTYCFRITLKYNMFKSLNISFFSMLMLTVSIMYYVCIHTRNRCYTIRFVFIVVYDINN